MRYSNDDIVDGVVKDLLKRGCAFKNATGNGHAKLVFPNGHVLAIPGSVRDARSGMNFRSLARQIVAKGGLNGTQD